MLKCSVRELCGRHGEGVALDVDTVCAVYTVCLLTIVLPPSLLHQMKAAEESLKVQTRHRQRMQQSQAASEVRWHGYT